MTTMARLGAVPFLFLAASGAAQPLRTVAAEGTWATFAGKDGCQAMTAALLPARKNKVQARITVAFDTRRGGRKGEVAVRLNRPARAGSNVMLTVGKEPFLLAGRGDMAWSRGPAQEAAIIVAMRRGGGMRAEARDLAGRRIVDRYDLSGAATAIDAAAACSVSLEKR